MDEFDEKIDDAEDTLPAGLLGEEEDEEELDEELLGEVEGGDELEGADMA